MGEHISLGIRVSQVGKHISLGPDTCFPGRGTHITRDTCFSGVGTHITKDMRFYSLERCFFVLENRKRHFPGLYCLKKKLEKRPFLDEKRGLIPLENGGFFDFLNFLFL